MPPRCSLLPLLVPLVLAAAGCPSLPGHRCADSQACGALGQCEPDGLCSFPDPACPSGRAYGPEVAGERGGACVAPSGPDGGDGDGGGGAPCGAGQTLLYDSFDTVDPAPGFRVFSNAGGTAVEVGGELAITVDASAEAYAGYKSLVTYDLRGASVEIEATVVPTVPHTFMILELSDAAHELQLGYGTVTQTQMTAELDGANLAARDAVPGQRYWRVRESAGELIWELSADRGTWAELYRGATPIDMSAMTIEPWVWAENGGGESRFDNLAVCRP